LVERSAALDAKIAVQISDSGDVPLAVEKGNAGAAELRR